MELSPDLVLPRLRCAAVHASSGADPAGNAPVWDAVLAVEVPLPWPRDIGGSAPFDTLVAGSGGADPGGTIAGADGRRWRPQGLVPAGDGPGARVIAYERRAAPGPAGGGGARVRSGPFTRREWRVEGPAVAAALGAALLAADVDAVARFDDRRDDAPEGTVDLLLCTHGTRDVCCGGSGAAVHAEVEALLAEDAGCGGGVRLWRTSHTGGHRFAPTALSMPDGHAWAHLSAPAAIQLLTRSGDAADLAGNCRGSLTVDGAVCQVADREALSAFGWGWLDAERRAVVTAHERDTLATTVVVDGVLADGTAAGLAVRVELDHHAAMPTCGWAGGPEFATEPVWRATRIGVPRGSEPQ